MARRISGEKYITELNTGRKNLSGGYEETIRCRTLEIVDTRGAPRAVIANMDDETVFVMLDAMERRIFKIRVFANGKLEAIFPRNTADFFLPGKP